MITSADVGQIADIGDRVREFPNQRRTIRLVDIQRWLSVEPFPGRLCIREPLLHDIPLLTDGAATPWVFREIIAFLSHTVDKMKKRPRVGALSR